MKKTSLLLLFLLTLTSCNTRYPDARKILTLDESDGELVNLSLDEFINKVNSTSLLMLSSSICGHCEMAKEIYLEPFVKENKVDLYYIEINELSNENRSKFDTLLTEKEVYYNGVPYMFIMENGTYINEEEDFNYFIDFIK